MEAARISKKSGKYGKLDQPFIICLNFTSPFGLHWDDIIDALYGSRFYNLSTGLSGRKTDRVFGYEKNPKLTRVSGILVSDVHYMTIHRSQVRYFHNPYGSKPFTFDGLLPETIFNERGLDLIDGHPLSHYIDALAKWK